MQPLGLNEIREKFLRFFEEKDHYRMKSFPLVPQNDKSLLLINAGMAPLKPYFTGQEVPPSKRVTTCQKCIRTGDIENVGKTSRHGTFFEMLGNFSFGDYFKKEIIPWSWEFVTEVMEIPADKLYVSIFQDDDEVFEIWNKTVGIAKERIFRMGKEDNFWEVGTGPCGPCSEIYYDRGPKFGCGKEDCTVGCECDRYIEFWNLVFTQFNKEEDGSYTDLANPNIDTGMGLERIAAMMQGVDSIFDVDTIKAVRDAVCAIANVKYGASNKQDVSIRVITDHIRAVTFMTADGVLPSNEGRGYVLRRLLRRAARHGKMLGIDTTFLTRVSQVVIEHAKDAYPELAEKQDYIYKVLSVEENRFYETLDQGMTLLKERIAVLREKKAGELSGMDAFKLYDTFGFPLDLMEEILAEEGFKVAVGDFEKEMEKQKERARHAREETTYMGAGETVYHKLPVEGHTEFMGYASLRLEQVELQALILDNAIMDQAKEGDEVSLILSHTPFYAESGGQKGDIGSIYTKDGKVEIIDCIKIPGNKFAHIGKVLSGVIRKGDMVTAEVDCENRLATARNHTATHLLQKALREVLGNHVEQAGSFVAADRLRFDFTHFAPLTENELAEVENRVNQQVLSGIDVTTMEKSIDEARQMGAMALFGEKYGQVVRVVAIGDYSIELCGGTHLNNTAQVGVFKILSENGVAAGVRRIEALTGKGALDYFKEQDRKLTAISQILKTTRENIIQKVEQYITNAKELRSKIEKLQSKMSANVLDDVIAAGETYKETLIVTGKFDDMDMNSLRVMGDQIRNKMGSGVLALASAKDGKVNLVAMVTDDQVKKGCNAGQIVKEAAMVCGGSGGGKPGVAQAGGKNPEKIEEALVKAKEVTKSQIKG